MKKFNELGLNSNIMKSLDELGFVEPTPIQEKAIPFLLNSEKDLVALAETGTGKTAAFSLPILNQIKSGERDLQAIILCPTRELCLQIYQDIKKYAKHSKDISVTAVYGGERLETQMRTLKRGVNIVVGTPGRVHDLIRRKSLKLQSIKWVVLDEADHMLDMGFKEDLDAILEQTPKVKQTLLFSATMSRSVNTIAKKYMREADEISIGEKNAGSKNVEHEYYLVQARDRFQALQRVIDFVPDIYGIIFCRTKIETQEIADKLRQSNYDTEAMHGDVSQSMRTKIMARFKQKQVKLLVATDVAARGIDVNDLTHVINYNLPDKSESYTHRSGRTGRAQKKGVSITIATQRELGKIRRIEKIINKKIEYKKVPNGKDIYNQKMDVFVENIKASVDIKPKNPKSFHEITDRLDDVSKEDLIKYFISTFSNISEETEHSYDLNAKAMSYSDRGSSRNRTRRSGGGNGRSRGRNRGNKSSSYPRKNQLKTSDRSFKGRRKSNFKKSK
jgi:ATP-dependent RNA helicase DeaD